MGRCGSQSGLVEGSHSLDRVQGQNLELFSLRGPSSNDRQWALEGRGDPRPPGAKEAPESPSHGPTGWRRALSPTRRLCWPGVLARRGVRTSFRKEGRGRGRLPGRRPPPHPPPPRTFRVHISAATAPAIGTELLPASAARGAVPGRGGRGLTREGRAAPSAPPPGPQLRGPRREESRPGRRRPGSSSRAGLALPPRRPRLRAAAAKPGRARWVRPPSCRRLHVPERSPWHPRQRRAPEPGRGERAAGSRDPGPAAWGAWRPRAAPAPAARALRARAAPASGQAGDPPPGLRPGGGCRPRGSAWPGGRLGPGRQRRTGREGAAWEAEEGGRGRRGQVGGRGGRAPQSPGAALLVPTLTCMEMTLALVPIRVL